MKHGFDFNKNLYDGIYYISKEKEDEIKNTLKLNEIREQIKEKQKDITPEMEAFVHFHQKNICDFLERKTEPGEELKISIKYKKLRAYLHLENEVCSIINPSNNKNNLFNR